MRELKLMNRTPIFLLNGIFTAILIPGIFLLMFLTGGEDSSKLTDLFLSGKPVLKILAAAAFCLVSGALNGTASSAFSREGRQFWLSKIIPVPYKQQILGKIFHSLLVAGLGTAMALIVVMVFFKLKLLEVLAVLILSFVASVSFISIGLTIDLSRPLLDWISPQRAIKQNMNVFLAMVCEFILLAGTGFLCYRMIKAGWSNLTILAVVFITYIILAGITLSYLIKSAPGKYSKIQT